jgi:class 3 adenylate cyclase
VTPADYERAGIYDPAAPGAAGRLELLEWLRGLGVTLEQMVFAHQNGGLAFIASGLALRPGTRIGRAALPARLGMPAAQLESFLVALGLPPDAPDAATFTESEVELFQSIAIGIDLLSESGMRRLARVVGQSVARIAEAMIETNRETRLAPASASNSELAYAQAVLRSSERAYAPAALVRGLLPVHIEMSARRLRSGRASDAVVTTRGCIAFVDLVGFTTLSRRSSPEALSELIDRFEEVAHDVATLRQGRVVKFIGDAVMVMTPEVLPACDIALTLIEHFAGDAEVTPRGGIASGALIDHGGDYYGPIVNLAARIADLAVPSEVLASQEVATALAGSLLRCEPAGRRTLRGFDAPVSLVSVSRAAR